LDILRSNDFKAAAMQRYSDVWLDDPEEDFKQWNTSCNVDVNQLHLLLQLINAKDNTDYQLGFITRNRLILPDGRLTYAITIFPNRPSRSVHGPVLWILNDNHEYLTGPKAGYSALSHWEGFSQTPNQYGIDQVNSWGLSGAAQVLIDNGIFQVDKNRPFGSLLAQSIPGGHFAVTADQELWNTYIQEVYASTKEPSKIVCSLDGTGLDVIPHQLLFPIRTTPRQASNSPTPTATLSNTVSPTTKALLPNNNVLIKQELPILPLMKAAQGKNFPSPSSQNKT
jgi:hypothetical protein